MKGAFSYMEKQSIESANCAIGKSQAFSNKKFILFYIGIGALILSICYVIYFVMSLSEKINELWTFLSELSTVKYNSLKAIYLKRIETISGIKNTEIADYIVNEAPEAIEFKINFFQVWKYSWRLLIFICTSILFYLLTTFVFCPEVQSNIANHSSLIQIFNKNSNIVYLSMMYTLEFYLNNTDISMNTYFPNNNFIGDPRVELNQVISNYNGYKQDIFNPAYKKYFPNDIYKIIFEEVQNSTFGYSHYGIQIGINNLLLESGYMKASLLIENTEPRVKCTVEMMNFQENIRLILDNQFKELLKNTFESIEIIAIVYMISSILLYFCLYLPYLNQEADHLRCIQAFSNLVKSDIRATIN